MTLILDFKHLNRRQALVLVMCFQSFCYQPIEGNREPILYPRLLSSKAKVSLGPLIITCALCSFHKSFSQSLPEPGLHLSRLISSHQRHYQVWRSQAPLFCQHLVDQHRVCVAAHPHKLDVKR